MSTDFPREPVMVEVAKSMLDVQDGRVHTFRNATGVLVGADWNEADVISSIRQHGCELSGEIATSMHHGLCLHDARGWVFFRTKDGPS